MNRKKLSFKRTLACLMVVIMTLSAVPMSCFVGLELPEWSQLFAAKASAASSDYLISGFCGEVTETTDGTQLSWTLDDAGTLTVTGTGRMAVEAFNYDLRIKNVVIGEGVENIASYAFNKCKNLVSVDVQNGAKSIDDYAFYECSKLTDVTLPDSLTSIGSLAFVYCRALTNITLPDSLTNIGSGAFLYCDALTTVSIGSSLTSIDSDVFRGCNSLTDITLPDSLTSIGSYAFSSCGSLTNITLPDSLTSIDSYAFTYCALTDIVLPDSVASVGIQAFLECKSLATVTIGSGLKSLAFNAFKSCSKLSSISVSEDNTAYASVDGIVYNKEKTKLHIVPNAVSGEITIPATVEEFSCDAIYSCINLTAINVEGGNPNYKSVDGIVYTADGKTVICCPRGKVGSVTVQNGVELINVSAFLGCDKLTDITLPDSLTSIGSSAFYGCFGLTSVNIGDSVTSIGESAFKNCTGLTSLNIPDSVVTIIENAFYGCTGLTSITLGKGVQDLGYNSFYNCRNLRKLNWNAVSVNPILYDYHIGFGTTEDIPWSAFQYGGKGSDGIEVVFGDSVKIVPDGAFAGFNLNYTGTNIVYKGHVNVKSVRFGKNIQYIGADAFLSCDRLSEIKWDAENVSVCEDAFDCAGTAGDGINVVFGDGVKSIPAKVFVGPSYSYGIPPLKIASVTIGKNVTSIGHDAFYNCSGPTSVHISDLSAWCKIAFADSDSNPLNKNGKLYINGKLTTDIVVPDGVESIGWYAFSGFNGLTSVTIPNSVRSIGGSAFSGCTRLTRVTVSDSVTSIDNNAFWDCMNLKDVYYAGSQEQWKAISISSSNDPLSTATLHFNHKHSYSSTVTKKATCTASGVTAYTCVCGYSYTKAIPALSHKNAVSKAAVAATCVKSGYTAGKYCPDCGKWLSGHQTVAATGKHTYKVAVPTKASYTANGKKVSTCTVCKKAVTTEIPKVTYFKLSATSYTYNGKVLTPTVTVKDSKGKVLKNGTDYTVKYDAGRKNPGKYTVTVILKGNYTGNKPLTFTILPGKTSSLTFTQTESSIKAAWKAVTGASGYKVTLYSAKNKAIKTVYTTKATYIFSKLSKGTTYKVRVTAYKTVGKDKLYASAYTQLTTATKPGTPTLSATAGTKKATLKWNKQTGATGYVVYMATSKNGKYTKIATLKGNTKVSYTKTGLTKGKTYYFKVAAYETVGGKNIYGSFSSVKYAKIK